MRFNLDRKLFKNCFIISLIVFLVELLFIMNNCRCNTFILIGIISELFFVISIVNKKLIFSPIVLSDLLIICMLLCQLRLVKSYPEISYKAIITILLVAFVWRFINIYNSKTIKRFSSNINFNLRIKENNFKIILSLLFLIAAFFMFLEWYVAGGIPALRSDSEVFRFKVSINGITHILAIMNKIVAVLASSYLICCNNKKIDFIFLIIFSLSTLFIYFTSMRGELIVILFVISILWLIKKKITVMKVILALIPIIFIIALIPIVRKYGIYGMQYVYNQMDISTYPKIWYLTPLYQTLVDGIRVFDIVTEMYPNNFSYGFISYSVLSQIPFFDMGMNVSQNIAIYTNSFFYSGLTSTYLGPCYADGGIIGCLIYTIIMACWSKYVFIKFVEKQNFLYTVLYAYMFYNILMLAYGNTIIELSFICYYILIYSVCKLIKKGNNI